MGGKSKNMRESKRANRIYGRGPHGKTALLGFLQRGGTVRAGVVPNRRKDTLDLAIREKVKRGTTVYTDALHSYDDLRYGYTHEVVDHAIEHVRGRVHTNGLENFWSLLKRAIRGTYVSVEPFHLMRHLAEEVFRYNEREITDSDRFQQAVGSAAGKRLTRNALTCQEVG